MKRNDPRLIFADGVEALGLYIPCVFIHLNAPERFSGGWLTAWNIFFWYYTCTRIVRTFFPWIFEKYEITDAGVVLKHGYFARSVTKVLWSDLTSARLSQNLSQRFLKINSVEFGLGAGDKKKLCIKAVAPDEANDILSKYAAYKENSTQLLPMRDWRLEPQSSSESATEQHPSSFSTLYAMKPHDFFIMSIVYGQFLLLIPALFNAYFEISEWYALPEIGQLSQIVNSSDSLGIAFSLIMGTILFSLFYGWAYANALYFGFKVLEASGELRLQGGLVTKSDRTVKPHTVSGLRLFSHPVMRLLGRTQLRWLSREPGKALSTRTLIPVDKLELAESIIANFFPTFRKELFEKRSQTSYLYVASLTFILFLKFVAIVAACSLFFANLTIPVAIFFTLVAIVYLDRRFTVVYTDNNCASIRVTRGFLWRDDFRVPLSHGAVCIVKKSLLTSALGRSNVIIHLVDGKKLSLRLNAICLELANDVQSSIVSSNSQPIVKQTLTSLRRTSTESGEVLESSTAA